MGTFVKAEIWTIAKTDQGNAVLVRPIGSEIAVPIFIGQLETQSILIGFGDVPIPRPLTHDLMISLMHSMNISLARMEINDLKDGTYFARLIFERKGLPMDSEFTLDARPSDALALAVREKCPVYIAEQVVDAAGVSVNLIIEASVDTLKEFSEENPQTDFLSSKTDEVEETEKLGKELKRKELLRELERAVEAEEYETAARIRDLLADME